MGIYFSQRFRSQQYIYTGRINQYSYKDTLEKCLKQSTTLFFFIVFFYCFSSLCFFIAFLHCLMEEAKIRYFSRMHYEAKSSKSAQKWVFLNELFLSIFCYNLLANQSNDEKETLFGPLIVFYSDKHFSYLVEGKKSVQKFAYFLYTYTFFNFAIFFLI